MPKQEGKKIYRIILAITNFVKSSTNAILFATNLLKYSNLKLILLNVFENPDNNASMLISVEDILSNDSETGLKKQAANIKSALKGKKLNIVTYSAAGKLKNVVNTIIKSEDIDLIVAGIPESYPSGSLNNIPILFMGQKRYPVLIVPENYSGKSTKNALVINLESSRDSTNVKELEHIINYGHISKHSISLNKNKINSTTATSLHNILIKQKVDIIIVIPSPGDKIDSALLQYHVQELYLSGIALLNS